MHRDVAFIELRRKLAAQKAEYEYRYCEETNPGTNHRPGPRNGLAHGGTVALFGPANGLHLLFGKLLVEQHRDHRRDEGQRQHKGRSQREHHCDRHGREGLALDPGKGEQRREDEEDNRLTVDGRFDHFLRCETRFGQSLAQSEQAALAVLSGCKPGDAVLDNDDRTIDDQAKVERAQAHQIARDTEPVHADRCHEHRYGNDQRGDYGGADIAEQEEQDGDHEQCAFEQVLFDGGDRRID